MNLLDILSNRLDDFELSRDGNYFHYTNRNRNRRYRDIPLDVFIMSPVDVLLRSREKYEKEFGKADKNDEELTWELMEDAAIYDDMVEHLLEALNIPTDEDDDDDIDRFNKLQSILLDNNNN